MLLRQLPERGQFYPPQDASTQYSENIYFDSRKEGTEIAEVSKCLTRFLWVYELESLPTLL